MRNKIGANCLVCKFDDFGLVLEHTLLNFANIIGLNYNVEKLFVYNSPKRCWRIYIRSLVMKLYIASLIKPIVKNCFVFNGNINDVHYTTTFVIKRYFLV